MGNLECKPWDFTQSGKLTDTWVVNLECKPWDFTQSGKLTDTWVGNLNIGRGILHKAVSWYMGWEFGMQTLGFYTKRWVDTWVGNLECRPWDFTRSGELIHGLGIRNADLGILHEAVSWYMGWEFGMQTLGFYTKRWVDTWVGNSECRPWDFTRSGELIHGLGIRNADLGILHEAVSWYMGWEFGMQTLGFYTKRWVDTWVGNL